MRGRIWIFAVLVAAALAVHLVLISARIAHNAEDTIRSHVALSTAALRAQLELLDARLSPRAVAAVPELIEITRPPADPTEAVARPDEKALRAAASAISPEPDLIAVVNRQGAIVSRRAKAAQVLDDASKVPLARAALEGSPAPSFGTYDGVPYRLAAARIPGNGAAIVVGTVVDDRFAAQLKSQVDADVTLIQGGKVLASSLPQGDERSRLLRWAAAPAPGYGVLQVWLPGLENKLSGKLPRGTTRYAVRGALVPIDSGVTAALTVPAAPYLGWLARYQAFYLAAFVLFLLFSLFWGLTARAPKAAVVQQEAPPPPPGRAPQASPSLDVGQPAAAPKRTEEEVPWAAAEIRGEHAGEPKVVSRGGVAIESGAAPEMSANEDHPMWSADPFAPTPPASAPTAPEEKPQEMSAEEAGLVEAAPEPPPLPLDPELPMPETPPPAEKASSAAKGDFSFADLLDESHRAPTAAADERPFPGDEPTKVQPVSAALLDKTRERDEEPAPAPPAPFGSLVDEGERTVESPPPQMEAATEAPVTMQDFSMPAVAAEDPDEQHWRETFDKFKELKAQLGEPADRISFEKFATKLRKNRNDLLAKHNCKGVRFSVYEKDGKAAIKASAIR